MLTIQKILIKMMTLCFISCMFSMFFDIVLSLDIVVVKFGRGFRLSCILDLH
jgi:hypothetical protein